MAGKRKKAVIWYRFPALDFILRENTCILRENTCILRENTCINLRREHAPQYSTPLKSENGDGPDASVSGLLPLEEKGCIHL